MNTLKLLILSNQSLFFESLLDSMGFEQNGMEVKLNGLSGFKNSVVIDKIKPNLILLDTDNPTINVWVLLKSLRSRYKDIDLLILSSQIDDIYVNHAVELGVKGYVLKSSPKEILMGALKIVADGKYYFDPGNTIPYRPQHNGKLWKLQKSYRLSAREAQIVLFISEGMTSKQIAEHLDLSFHTIETHRKNIYTKMKINKVNELFKTLGNLENNKEFKDFGFSPS